MLKAEKLAAKGNSFGANHFRRHPLAARYQPTPSAHFGPFRIAAARRPQWPADCHTKACMSRLYFLILCVSLVLAISAQPKWQDARVQNGLQTQTEISGRVVTTSGAVPTGLFVEVAELGGTPSVLKVPVTGDGMFRFSGSPTASYEMKVIDLFGSVLTDDIVTPAGAGSVDLRIPEHRAEPPAGGTVSVFELAHKIPSSALKEAREADKEFKKHNTTGYIEHVRKALAIDPDYVLAHRNLGVMLLQAGRHEEAICEFEQVLKRNPKSMDVYVAISSAYLQSGKFAEAEATARRALGVDPNHDLNRYMLGLALERQAKNDDEALQQLQKVSRRVPKAHLIAAEILQRIGQKDKAKVQLQTYLSTDTDDDRSQVKRWLSSLN